MKKFTLAFLLSICAYLANAAILYWQVSADDVTGIEESWNAAQLYEDGVLVTSTKYWDSYNNTLVSDPTTKISAPMGTGYVYNMSDGGVGSHTYYVELWNYDSWSSSGHAVARSQTYGKGAAAITKTYADEASLTATLSTPSTVVAWHASGYTAVPEPTSAMLMLFGAAFLGLKRKNRRMA